MELISEAIWSLAFLCCEGFLTIDSITLLVVGVAGFSVSSCVSFDRLYVSNHRFIFYSKSQVSFFSFARVRSLVMWFA